jgi:hypothetical protein
MAWDSAALLYQPDPGAVVRLDAESGRAARTDLPGAAAGELSGACVLAEYLVLTLRQGNDTVLVSFASGREPVLARYESADVAYLCPCDAGRVVLALTDRTIRLLDAAAPDPPAHRLAVDRAAACVACDGDTLLWITDRGGFRSWRIGEAGEPRHLQLRSGVLRENSVVRAQRLAALPDRTFDAVSITNAFRFTVADGAAGAGYKLQAAFRGPGGESYVIQIRDDGIWLLNGGTRGELRIADATHIHYRYAFALDRTGHLLAVNPLGGGQLIDLATNRARPVAAIPPTGSSAAADPAGGFWVATRLGDISFISLAGDCVLAGRVDLASPSKAQLLLAGAYLVWHGVGLHSTKTGSDSVDALVVYERNAHRPGSLTALGTRCFEKAEGPLLAAGYDPAAGQVVTVHASNSQAIRELKRGTPREFLDGRQEVRPLPDVKDVTRRIKAEEGGAGLWLLGSEGLLERLDARTLRPLAVLAPRLPFTEIATETSGGRSVLLIQNETRLVQCTYEEAS